MSTSVSKHMTVVGELSRLVDRRKLLDLSQLEQEIACIQDRTSHLEKVRRAILDDKVPVQEKVRLAMLYALRYEREARSLLSDLPNILPPDDCQVIQTLLKYGGEDARGWDLFGNKQSFLSIAKESMTRGLTGFRAQENALLLHQPHLNKVLDAIANNTLHNMDIASQDGSSYPGMPKEVIIFFVDGVTYAEARAVHEFNQNRSSTTGMRLIIGGTSVLNSQMFIQGLKHLSVK
eukprot:TRINITY_DN1478_c0_g1::TRINITY_DN1478_c0_g1_i1::g.27167::m.27167 TRINITY_DN1478_c0_g1::TRINITY_DN1478_c0_g1_i1::g.27167  ORF type:complete len:273 (-),score=57.47,sp/O08700/VPS45_RAT/38.29/2e-52,Sec1/PF00995.18/4.6e-47 TRINITY_DN1478_c0_g1_i1:179-880(-)